MTCPSQDIHYLFRIVVSSRHFSPLSSIIIPCISHITVMVMQMVINCQPCNYPMWPFSWWKWSVHPNNPPGLDTDTNVIVRARPVELVAVPFWIKGSQFLDMKTHTIRHHLESVTWIHHHVLILKMNLCDKAKVFVSKCQQTTKAKIQQILVLTKSMLDAQSMKSSTMFF